MKQRRMQLNILSFLILNLVLLLKNILAADCSNDPGAPFVFSVTLSATGLGTPVPLIGCDVPTNGFDYYINMVVDLTGGDANYLPINTILFDNPSDVPGTMVRAKYVQFNSRDI